MIEALKNRHQVEYQAYLSVADDDKKLIFGSQATRSSIPAVPTKLFQEPWVKSFANIDYITKQKKNIKFKGKSEHGYKISRILVYPEPTVPLNFLYCGQKALTFGTILQIQNDQGVPSINQLVIYSII